MKISIVLVSDLNKEFFDLFNNRDDISDLLNYYSFTAKKNEIIFITKSLVKSNENIIVVGTNGCDSVEDWVSSGALTGKKIKFNVELSFIDLTKNADLESLEFGIYLSQYSFDYFKSDIGEDYQIDIESSTFSEEIRNKIDSIFWTRDMVNYPALTKSPSFFEEQVKQLIKDTVIKLSSFDDVWLEKNNFGGITGVGSGSERKPKLLVGEYNPDAEFQISIIGKGVLFDSGGLSLKSPAGMETMKTDMAGAATAWGIIALVAKQKLNIGLKVYTPIVENMPSGSSIRPGDVLKMRNNKTIEVLNTDAEGRLIMADALAYASEFKPNVICDVATLTGASYVALGVEIGAVFSNDNELSEKFINSNNNSHELYHRLPLEKNYKKLINSDIADIQNTGGRFGGAITAALLLEEFVNGIPWIHLDMAGPARSRDNHPVNPRGGTGFGVIGFYNFVKNLSKDFH
jgi:leucyl aminopeptidase